MDDPLADPLRRGVTPAAEAPAVEKPMAKADVEEAFTESPAEPQAEPEPSVEPEPQPVVPPVSEPAAEPTPAPADVDDLFGEPAAAALNSRS